MKRITYILLFFSALFSSCTAFRAVKYGTPTTDTYLNFATITPNDRIKPVLMYGIIMLNISK